MAASDEVRAALAAADPPAALAALGRTPATARLVAELFTVAARRAFPARDPRAVTRYVRDLLERGGQPPRGAAARHTEAVLRAALGEPEAATGVPAAARRAAVHRVTADLAGPPGTPPAATAALVALAGSRLDRAGAARGTRRPAGPRLSGTGGPWAAGTGPWAAGTGSWAAGTGPWAAGTGASPAAGTGGPRTTGVGGPRTAAGRYLWATATGRPAALPADPGCRGGRLVWFRAFEALVRRRFTTGHPVADVTRTVAAVARRHPAAGLPRPAAELLVRHVLGEDVPVDGLHPRAVAAVHVAVAAALADDLALSDAEVAAVVTAAEAADAVRPTAPPGAASPG